MQPKPTLGRQSLPILVASNSTIPTYCHQAFRDIPEKFHVHQAWARPPERTHSMRQQPSMPPEASSAKLYQPQHHRPFRTRQSSIQMINPGGVELHTIPQTFLHSHFDYRCAGRPLMRSEWTAGLLSARLIADRAIVPASCPIQPMATK